MKDNTLILNQTDTIRIADIDRQIETLNSERTQLLDDIATRQEEITTIAAAAYDAARDALDVAVAVAVAADAAVAAYESSRDALAAEGIAYAYDTTASDAYDAAVLACDTCSSDLFVAADAAVAARS